MKKYFQECEVSLSRHVYVINFLCDFFFPIDYEKENLTPVSS